MTINLDFIALGDVHLTGLNSLFGDVGDDHIYYVLDQVVSFAKENGITEIVQLGDIFDHPSPTQEEIVRLTHYIIKSGLNWHILIGNHDQVTENTDNHSSVLIKFLSQHELIPTLRIYDAPTEVRIGRIPFCMLPSPTIKTKPTKYPTINCSHVDVVGAVWDNGRKVTKGANFDEDILDFNLNGHIHKHQVLGASKRTVLPGMPLMKTFGDDFNKGFVYCQAKWSKTKLSVKHKFIPVNLPFKLHNLKVESLSDLTFVKEADKTKNLFKLFVKTSSDFVLPPDFLANHPNIVNHHLFKNNAELKAFQEEGLLIGDIETVDGATIVTQNLESFLKSKQFNEKKVARAVGFVEDIISEIRQREA